MQAVISSDKLLGDFLSEYDFFEKLYSKTDLVTNEILITLLTCNNISSFYSE